MKNVIAVISSALVVSSPAGAALVLGDQDFEDGQILVNSQQFQDASVGEPYPFDTFLPGDSVANFAASWEFSFVPGSLVEPLMLTLGIFDHDSKAPGEQVASFMVDGVDLTALLNSAFESHGGKQREVNVYTVELPLEVADSSLDGALVFYLELQGPSLGDSGTLPKNGAGLDFSSLQAVPSPGACSCWGVALLLLRRSRDRCRRVFGD